MRATWSLVFPIFAISMAGIFAITFTIACQPQDERPGAWLRGERAEEPVADWRFTDEIQEIFIETRTWYGIRHSTTIWCAELDGRLYVGSYDDDVKYWERNLAHDPEARLRIASRIYDVTVTPVTSPELTGNLDARYETKYDMEAVFGDSPPGWRYYEIAGRER
jgi:hypothetical protein